MSSQRKDPNADPWPYDGPIARADGRRSYNHYLWPLEGDWYWANRQLDDRISGRFHFSVVALLDGRWSATGWVYEIEKGKRVFATRDAALRSSVAEFIVLCRAARAWSGHDHLSEKLATRLIAWAYQVLHRPAPNLRPRPVSPPVRKATGLPLLDLMTS